MLKLRSWHLVTLLTAATGCGPSPAEVATHTRHCGGVLLRPDLLMRLSMHTAGIDSTPEWIVQACHPRGGCQPILTYYHAMPPVYSLERDGTVRIELLGGRVTEVHSKEIKRRGGAIPVVVTSMPGRGQAERDAFRARLGLPPGSYSQDNCDPALEARPSFSAPSAPQ